MWARCWNLRLKVWYRQHMTLLSPVCVLGGQGRTFTVLYLVIVKTRHPFFCVRACVHRERDWERIIPSSPTPSQTLSYRCYLNVSTGWRDKEGGTPVIFTKERIFTDKITCIQGKERIKPSVFSIWTCFHVNDHIRSTQSSMSCMCECVCERKI